MKKRILIVMGLLISFLFSSNLVFSNEKLVTRKESSVNVVVKPTKSSYKPGEPVTLAVAVANFRSKPIYIPVTEQDSLSPYLWIKDVNGLTVGGALVDEPNKPVPSHYYMQRDGKSMLVYPVLEVKPQGLLLTFIPNALKRFYKKPGPGRYYLEPQGFPIILEAVSVTSRPEYPKYAWAESLTNVIMVKHEPIEITIEEPVP